MRQPGRPSDQALAFAHDSGEARLAATASRDLATLLLYQGDLAGSEKLLAALEGAARESGDSYGLAGDLDVQGDVRAAKGDLAGASESYREALALYKKLKSAPQTAVTDLELARIQAEQHRLGDAASQARKVVADSQRRKNPALEAEATILLARIAREQRRVAEAQKLIDQVAGLVSSNSAVNLQLELAAEIARIQAAGGSAKNAREKLAAALTGLGPKAAIASQLEAHLAQAEIESKAGDAAAARAHLESLENDAAVKGFLLVSRKAMSLRNREAAR